jgi:diacylglycerol kinase family enzyme
MTQPELLEIVNDTLKYSDAGVEGSVDFGDIFCVLSVSTSRHSVLFFHSESDGPEPERVYLKKIDIRSLPTELSTFVTIIPSHLRQDNKTAIQVVISTGSGTGKAKTIYQDAVQPLFTYLGITNPEVYETESTQTITDLARSNFLERAHNGVPQTIILLSGDGGLVDILDVFYKSKRTISVPPNLVLIPCGTGNAMASSIGLRSGPLPGLSTLLQGSASPVPVFAAKFSPGSRLVIDEGRQRVPIDIDEVDRQTLYGAVVASWGLHAALVADSDTAEYRKFGVDRFKLAANELLYPSDGTPSHRFKGKITITTSDGTNETRQAVEELEHMYALATLVPRLEKEFLISPDSVPLSGQMKLVRFGPMSPEEAMHLMTLAYQGGQHVLESTVTYVDIEEVRIDFQEDEERWRRICIDGKIVAVERDGWVELHKELSRLLNLIH